MEKFQLPGSDIACLEAAGDNRQPVLTGPHVLLAAYGGGHVNALLPIATRLEEQGAKVSFLALTTARQACERMGLSCFSFADFPEATAPDVQQWGKRLMAGGQGSSSVPLEESIAYHGVNFCELMKRHGSEDALTLYEKQGRQAFYPINAMTRLLDRLQPDLVIATNSPRAERALINAAGAKGIPSICLVDFLAPKEIAWIGMKGFATRVCVLNEKVRLRFLRAGRDHDEVVTTGNPAFDKHLTDSARQAGAEHRHKMGWREDEIVLLWASQPEPAVHPFDPGLRGDANLPRRVQDILTGFVAVNPAVRLVIRPHPSEIVPTVDAPGICVSTQDESLAALLWAVDLVVVLTTTVGLEADMIGKPVVNVLGSVFDADVPFAELGIGTQVNRPEVLPEVLSGIVAEIRSSEKPVRNREEAIRSAADNVLAVVADLVASAGKQVS